MSEDSKPIGSLRFKIEKDEETGKNVYGYIGSVFRGRFEESDDVSLSHKGEDGQFHKAVAIKYADGTVVDITDKYIQYRKYASDDAGF